MSWRWIFFLNLPLGALALIFAWRPVAHGVSSTQRPFDWPGFFGSAIDIASASYAVELIGRNPAPLGEIAGFGLIGVALITWSIRHFRRASHPPLDLEAFKHPSFALSNHGGSLFRIAIGAIPFLLPLLFQVGFGYSPFDAGLMMMGVFAGNLAMKPAKTSILRRHGFLRVLVASGALNVATIAACAFYSTNAVSVDLRAPVRCRPLPLHAVHRHQHSRLRRHSFAMHDRRQYGLQLSAGLGISIGAITLRID